MLITIIIAILVVVWLVFWVFLALDTLVNPYAADNPGEAALVAFAIGCAPVTVCWVLS